MWTAFAFIFTFFIVAVFFFFLGVLVGAGIIYNLATDNAKGEEERTKPKDATP